MSYFTSEYLAFFEELSKKNNKAWFDANRKRYEEHVKRPFEAFVSEMIDRIKVADPEVAITAKDAIFRINKDIRFSKDKSLYKTHMAANVSKEGRRSKEWPGFYFQFGADQVAVGGGAYVVEPPTLLKIRKAIADEVPAFQRLVRSKTFTSAYGSLQGERNKVMPPEFREATATEPLVANKQFYYMANLDPSILLKKDLPNRLLKYYQAGRDINAFLKRAMSGK
jgi:uncharacterized protein (TIGR02453 family)